MIVTVTGGAGYIGVGVVEELLAAGLEVRVLDSLLHGQETVARGIEKAGATLHRGDVRDPEARQRALEGAGAVVHLGAIVGDPACARDPELSQAVNVEATLALIADAGALGLERFVFASTCSNYGRMDDPTVPIDEGGELRPVSLYAEQKVIVERRLLETDDLRLHPTCLRFATIFGAAPRMRFDLTVNEFTRDLWAGRELEVYGELFWRPYVHVREAARAVLAVLQAPEGTVGGEVFNVGHSDDNFRKLDLANLITDHLGRGTVSYVQRSEDPRDYKVSFEKIRSTLGFEPARRVPDGITEIVAGLERGEFGDPFSPSYRN